MTTNRRIENALSSLVSGNIWPLSKPVKEDPDMYIVYNPENEDLDYGDDRDQDTEMSYQIHWFKRGMANYLNARRSIRDALRDAGFLLEPSPYVTYESDSGASVTGSATGWTHMVVTCRAEEE